MADNTDEEPIDKPANTQSANPSEEIIPTKDTETIDPNQESKYGRTSSGTRPGSTTS
jgi:hypothetical protein